VSYLLDTNVISELRKRSKIDAGILKWSSGTDPQAQYTSVVVIGELRRGVERKRLQDPLQADVLERWLERSIANFEGRILNIDQQVATVWGRMGIPDPVPVIDGLIAATAKVHDLTVVTRDKAILAMKDVKSINPFINGGL
jgi:toxin FitB